MKKILQIDFKFKIPRSELEKGFLQMAPDLVPAVMSRDFNGRYG